MMKFNNAAIQRSIKCTMQTAMQIFEENMDHEDTEILFLQVELYRLDLMTAAHERLLTEVLEPYSNAWSDAWDTLVELKLKREALAAYLDELTSEDADAGADHDHDGDGERRQTC